MSGTSLDGVDAVLAHFAEGEALRVEAHVHRPFDASLRAELLDLNSPGDNELHRAALAANALATVQAQAVADVLRAGSLRAAEVLAVGSHGQTVRHRPGAFDGIGYTLQLNQPALLAELCGVDVVADFRSRDVAAGGQGAPLVPAFHARVFGSPTETRAVLNLGGIGNLTLLPPTGSAQAVGGFDCGPGNALLDHVAARYLGRDFDEDGRWGAGGQVHDGLLQQLLAEPYLHQMPPKSTGRDLFNPTWLARQLAAWPRVSPQDQQATLAEFTAATAADALLRASPQTQRLLVCGGGAFNGDVMRRLQARLPAMVVASTAAWGLPPLQVEAAAFAWLAWAFLRREPGALTAVTGARAARVLGALYPA